MMPEKLQELKKMYSQKVKTGRKKNKLKIKSHIKPGHIKDKQNILKASEDKRERIFR